MPTLNVKKWTIILLLIAGIISGYHYGYESVLGQLAVAVICAVLTSGIADYLKTKKWKISESAIITGLIIGMVAGPNSSLMAIAVISVLAIISKYLFQINKRSVLNPAAFGLLIGILFFKLALGWWADYSHIITIILGAILMVKYAGHWKMIFAFLITFAALICYKAYFYHLVIVEELFLNMGISFFFTFFMLTDPKTAPIFPNQQAKFGMLTAIFTFVMSQIYPAASFTGGLLLANLTVPYINYKSMQKVKAQAVANAARAKESPSTNPKILK